MIELLEPRVAPASVLTFTDVDGDKVKITASRGDISDKGTFANVGAGQQLQILDLTGPGFQGANITTSVTKGPRGDGLVNIGFINATGRDLANITIKGDLGQIEIGDADLGTAALKLLNVRSIGRFGLTTQGGSGDLISNVSGALTALKIAGDFNDATLNAGGSIGSITIGGSLIGHTGGMIVASSDIGAVKIGKDLIGGFENGSGRVTSGGRISSVTIGGSLIGGTGDFSGEVDSLSDIGPVKIGRDIVGGEGLASGTITSSGDLGAVTVGGSILGGQGPESGKISSSLNMGAVKIGRDVIGGAGENSGGVSPNFSVVSITVGGSLIGGDGAFSGRFVSDGSIGPVKIGKDLRGVGERSGRIEASAVGAVTIGRSVIGGPSDLSGSIVTYSGDLGPVAIGRDLIGGGGADSGKIDAGGSLLKLTVGGSVIGGSGAQNTTVDNGGIRHEGQIFSVGNIGQIKIGRDVDAGSGASSGYIQTNARIAGLSAGGSINGILVSSGAQMGPISIGRDVVTSAFFALGSAASTMASVTVSGSVIGGEFVADAGIGPVNIRGDLVGTGLQSGSIATSGDLASVTIGGSLIGGNASLSGAILSGGSMGPVKIGGDVRGGSIGENGETIQSSGYISGGRIASVFIGGSIIAGTDNSATGSLLSNASVRASNDIGPITIKGSIVGNSSSGGITPVIISARGQETLGPNAKSDIAIQSLTVGGRVEWAEILGGFTPSDTESVGSNGNASIGPVKVGGDWVASSISAGVQDNNGNGFGNADDIVINNADDAIIARIASITIQGTVAGFTQPVPFTHFGFTAQQIGSFKSAGFTAPLTPATDAPIELSPSTGDVTIREVPPIAMLVALSSNKI